MPTSAVLDSYALLAFLKQEPGDREVVELMRQSSEGKLRLGVTGVNLGEVWYRFARFRSEMQADQAIIKLKALGLDIVEVDWALTRQAAAYKVQGGLSFADCFAAALARAWNTDLVTGDPEFKRLEKEVAIRWIGGR
jgi:predicted nucleic acid-binding protein